MSAREDYFARVRPVIGKGLRGKLVAARQLSLTGGVIELLAGCMLDRVVVPAHPEPVTWPLPHTCRGPALERQASSAQKLLRRHLQFKNHHEAVKLVCAGTPQLTLSAKLLGSDHSPGLVCDPHKRSLTLLQNGRDLFSQLNLSWAAARLAREILLGNAPWPQGTIYLGSAHWPWSEGPQALPPPQPTDLRALKGKHILVLGLGSVGSELLRILGPAGARYSLVDGGRVSVYNPPRQWFGSRDVGRPKAQVLAERLRPAPVRQVPNNLGEHNLPAFEQLLKRDLPDLVVLASGTADHGPLSRVLWKLGIPHLAACAYPRARFFEVDLAVPSEGTPCLHCFRGNLWRGQEAQVPLDDELSHFLYQEISEEERGQAWTDLVAEPATRIETSRIAQVAAQCAVEMLARPQRRASWLTRMLEQGTTCLLGGTTVEMVDGQYAYGLTRPGQVVRLGLGDVTGTEGSLTCPVCHRDLTIDHPIQLPHAPETLIDQALIA